MARAADEYFNLFDMFLAGWYLLIVFVFCWA